jgi:signal transduction histidine kinase
MYAETVAAGRTRGPEETREFATVAVREAEALTGMVERVLDFSRAAEAQAPEARVPLDLAALAEETAVWHRPLLERRGVRLEFRAGGPLPVLGDAAALRGAVSNLVENAARHGASGESVEVEARRAGSMAEVRVRDRGPGIPAGMERRIFERFVRGPGAVGSGAGLGLSLVRDAAESHGGRAEASNRSGGGAEFVLAVPLREEGA